MEYRISFETYNIEDPVHKLEVALKIITEEKDHDVNFPDVDEPALQRIVIAESDKTYLTKQVDEINKEGLFRGYKSLCKMIGALVSEIKPDYPYPHSLISTALEASNQQIFFAKHLPTLCDFSEAADPFPACYEFIKSFVFNSINP
jgi:hypothetical protein